MTEQERSNIMNLIREEREGREVGGCWYRPIAWIVVALVMMAVATVIAWFTCRVLQFVMAVMGWA